MENNFTVGLDFRPALISRAGTGRYTRELARAMIRLAPTVHLKLFGYSWKQPVDPVPVELQPYLKRRRIPNRALRLLYRLSGFSLENLLGEMNLFHYTHLVHPPLRETPFLSTVHDAAFLEEGFFPPEVSRGLEERARWAIENSRILLAPSSFAAGELVMRLGAKPEKTAGILLGCDHIEPVDPLPRPDQPYLLTVGTLEPRKNHLGMLHAFEKLVQLGYPHRWMVVGEKGWMFEPFLDALERSPAKDRVRLAQNIKEGDLALFYGGAEALVYPSFYEGFGLPPAEAMRCGTPVITSNVSSMPEVCGQAACYVDPHDPDSILEGMRKVLDDTAYRQGLRKAGTERADELTWERTARQTLKMYEAASLGKTGSMSRLF